MARTIDRSASGIVRAVGIGMTALALSLTMVGVTVNAQEAPSFKVRDFVVIPGPSARNVLLSLNSVQVELKLTGTQKKEQAAIDSRQFPKVLGEAAELST